LTESETLLKSSVRRLSSHRPLVLPTTLVLTSNSGGQVVVKLILVVVAVTLVLCGWDPKTRLPVVHGLVLAREVNSLALMTVAATLGEGAGALGELRGDGGVLGDPVGKSVFAVLDDTVMR
jgi:hypothetical protein